jgi:hypothetical protein
MSGVCLVFNCVGTVQFWTAKTPKPEVLEGLGYSVLGSPKLATFLVYRTTTATRNYPCAF